MRFSHFLRNWEGYFSPSLNKWPNASSDRYAVRRTWAMSYELARDLQKKCGVHVVPTSNRHIKLFLWFWEKCLCINEYDNKLSVYSLSTEHIMNSLDSRSHSSSGLPTSCRRKWLTTFIVHWSFPPFVMSRMNLLAWVNELQCRLILGKRMSIFRRSFRSIPTEFQQNWQFCVTLNLAM